MIYKIFLILLFDTEYPYKNMEQYHILQNVAMYLSCSLILSFLNLKGLESTSETHTNQSYIHTGICKYEIVLDWNCFSKSYHFYDSFCIQCKIIVQFDKMRKPLKIEYLSSSLYEKSVSLHETVPGLEFIRFSPQHLKFPYFFSRSTSLQSQEWHSKIYVHQCACLYLFLNINMYTNIYTCMTMNAYEPSDDTPRTSIILTTHYACKNAGKPFW